MMLQISYLDQEAHNINLNILLIETLLLQYLAIIQYIISTLRMATFEGVADNDEDRLADEGVDQCREIKNDGGTDDSQFPVFNLSTSTDKPTTNEYAAFFDSDEKNDSTLKRDHRIAFLTKCYGSPEDDGIWSASRNRKLFPPTKYQQFVDILVKWGDGSKADFLQFRRSL
jgi:hypothetical protein